jgi:enoyl-CoA hydratase/carnithine racemase
MTADLGTLSRLPLISRNWSLLNELALTGRFFSAQEGKDLGLLHHLLPTLDAALKKGHALATEIAANSPIAVHGTKEVLGRAKNKLVREGLEFIRQHNKSALITDDMPKAVQAIMAKEVASFQKL